VVDNSDDDVDNHYYKIYDEGKQKAGAMLLKCSISPCLYYNGVQFLRLKDKASQEENKKASLYIY
jgi:hypothetical protein